MRTTVFTSLLAACTFLAIPCRADVEFSNFAEPGDTHSNGGYTFNGNNNTYGYTQRSKINEFTASFTGSMTEVDVAAYCVTGTPSVTFKLYLNDPVTNSPLTATGITLGTTALPSNDRVVAFTLGTRIHLDMGQTYWLESAAGDPTTVGAWQNATTGTGSSGYSQDGDMTFTTSSGSVGAFRIDAVIPEPSTWLLEFVGCVMLTWGQLRRRSVRL